MLAVGKLSKLRAVHRWLLLAISPPLEAARPEAGSTGSMGSKPLFGGGGEKQLFFIGFVLTLDPSKAYGSYSKLQPERTVLLLKSFSNEKTF